MDGVSETLEQVRRRKVTDIDCDKAAVVHDRLWDTVEDLCNRWSLGVDKLTKVAQEVSTDSRSTSGTTSRIKG